MAQYESHDFYCIICGNKGIPLARPRGCRRQKNHRKKLYCPHCKKEVNHVECYTTKESQQFIIDWRNGKYQEEANVERMWDN